MNCLLWISLAALGLAAAQVPDLRWEFDASDEVASARNLTGARLSDSKLRGLTKWDPQVYLRLPADGIEASDYVSLQVRLYSSAPADLLDIYYKTAAEYWCLGGSLPIKAGWATYSVYLPQNRWRETHWPEARKWGGPDRHVVSLRIDPGNQAGRFVIIDWVRLTSTPLKTEVIPEPRLQARLVDSEVPEAVPAGESVTVKLALQITAGQPLDEVTAYARLQVPGALLAETEKPVKITGSGQVNVLLELDTLPAFAASADVYAGLHEALDTDAPEPEPIAHVKITGPPRRARNFPACEVRRVGGSPAVFVDGEPVPLFCFGTADTDLQLDDTQRSRHAEMAAVGIKIFSDWFGSSGSGFLGRVGPDEYDYTAFDLYFARILRQAPDALFLPHVYVTPPSWWQKSHPDEMCRYGDGGRGLQSFASTVWRSEIGKDLVKLIQHFRQAPYANRIIGLIICSGHTAEWQSWGLWSDRFVDYSKVAVQAWRRWLRERYESDEALRKAWADSEVSLSTAHPPSAKRRRAASHLLLRGPAADGDVVDYLTFLNELTAETILHFARLAKDASDRRLLVGAYYGYLSQHHYHQAESGHCGVERVLASADVDFLMSPPMYTDRDIGEVSAFMSAVDSVHRHDKIWLSEADYRTYHSDPGAGYGRTAIAEDSINVLWREFAHVLCKRAGVSWFDMDAGWLSGPDIPPELGKMLTIMKRSLSQRRGHQAQVAVFIDPHSFYYVQPDRELCQYLTMYPVVNLYRAGAPFDLYVLSDLWKADLPEYKLFVFLNFYER